MILSNIDKESILRLDRVLLSTGCWVLPNSNFDRYPIIFYNGQRYALHRLVCYLWHNLTLDDSRIIVRHKCNNKRCFCPEHLTIGSYGDNLLDAVRDGIHGQVKRKLCKLGHELDGIKYRRNGKRERYCKKCQIIANNKLRHR